MKRWITSLIAVMLVLSLSACGSQQGHTDAVEEESKDVLLRIADTDLFAESYAIAVSKDNEDLLERINLAISELKESKTIQRIERYYISGRGSRPESSYVAPGNAEVLKMGTCADLPPYIYHEDDEIAGIDVAVAECIAEKLGMKLEIVEMPFDAIVHQLAAGNIDIGMAAMTRTPDLDTAVNFSSSYSEENQALIVPEDSEIDSIGKVYNLIYTKDVAVHIGVVRDSVGKLYVADQFGETHMRVYKSQTDALHALEQGRIDCVITDDASAQYYLKTTD